MAGKTEKQEEPQGMKLSPQQIQAAAQSAVKLIAEGRLDVPSDVAMNGTLGALNAALSSLAQGATVLAAPAFVKELQEKVAELQKNLAAAEKKLAKKPAAKKKTTKR